MSFIIYAIAASQAICQVLIMVAAGNLLARKGFLTKENQKVLSKVNLYLFTPCLLFSKMAYVLSPQKFLAYWPIPLFYFGFLVISWFFSQLGSKIMRFSPSQTNFCTAAIIFSNANSLPIAIMQSLAWSKAGEILQWIEDDDQDDVAARCISYILFFAIFGNIVRWSYGYRLIASSKYPEDEEHLPSSIPPIVPEMLCPSDSFNSESDESGYRMPTPNSSTSTVYAQDDYFASKHGEVDSICEETPLLHNVKPEYSHGRKGVSIIKQGYQIFIKVMSPPLWAASCALVVGLISPLKHIFFDRSTFVYASFTRALEALGGAAIPVILVCLGAQMTDLSSTRRSEKSPVLPFIIAIRQFLIPLLVFPLVLFFIRTVNTPLATDPAFVVTMIVLGSAPTAINLVQICMAEQKFEAEMSRLLFWAYCVFTVPLMTIIVMLSLYIVKTLEL
ncbi:uncharacterized protein VTP21DRAFT_1774 [Calcarisporiella thermophila]|uniref:uncharacterized protein n=1 Tax=Calcarisporiella thermophila TaxID=911321 RepID=UPI0037439242